MTRNSILIELFFHEKPWVELPEFNENLQKPWGAYFARSRQESMTKINLKYK